MELKEEDLKKRVRHLRMRGGFVEGLRKGMRRRQRTNRFGQCENVRIGSGKLYSIGWTFLSYSGLEMRLEYPSTKGRFGVGMGC